MKKSRRPVDFSSTEEEGRAQSTDDEVQSIDKVNDALQQLAEPDQTISGTNVDEAGPSNVEPVQPPADIIRDPVLESRIEEDPNISAWSAFMKKRKTPKK